MELKFKKLHPNATIPSYAKDGDAGLDLTAVTMEIQDMYIEYGLGLAVELPLGHVGLIFPRSSISNKELLLSNSVGVIDQNFRGEIRARFKFNEKGKRPKEYFYKIGERVCQLVVMPYPKMQPIEVQELSETSRGSGGFGSTGV
jgi:dUTP pyrophosphatase